MQIKSFQPTGESRIIIKSINLNSFNNERSPILLTMPSSKKHGKNQSVNLSSVKHFKNEVMNKKVLKTTPKLQIVTKPIKVKTKV